MSKKFYKLYIESVIALAQTLSIKSEQSAFSLNNFIKLKYGNDAVDVNDKTSWKYYLNICGEYHFDDEVIYITSLDTLQTIPFTKESLAIHKSTARAYAYGTRFYRELVTLYPTKEQIILGVLYPADMQTAISAQDGSVLSYPKDLVESNEESLISDIENWVKNFRIRWDNIQFNSSDYLYSAANHAVLYLNLVPLIISLRLKACKTPQAHSFHVREYLSSHGMLDVYLDTLTKKQALFFYRNIAYIERNSGRKEIFTWLMDNIMTVRNLPLAEYVMYHDTSTMPQSLYSETTFRKRLLNLTNSLQTKDTVSLSKLLDKEDYLVPGNIDYRQTHEAKIAEMFKNSTSSVVATKVLESDVIEYVDNSGEDLNDILMNEWLYLSYKNLYPIYIRIKNPRTGAEIVLNAKDAFIYATYVFCRSINIVMENVQPMLAMHVQKIPTPDINNLMSVADSKYVDRAIAQQIIDYQPEITVIDSTEAFYNKCKEITLATKRQAGLVSNQQHLYTRGLVQAMVLRMYADEICTVVPETTLFSDWLLSKDIPNTDFSREEFLSIYKSIVTSATGLDLVVTQSLTNIQSSMIKMMTQLSSYSVQFITDISNSDVMSLKWASIRIGDVESINSSLYQVDNLCSDVIDVRTQSFAQTAINYAGLGFNETVTMSRSSLDSLEIKVKPRQTAIPVERLFKLHLGAYVINDDIISTLPEQGSHKTFIDYDTFYILTDAEKHKVVDIYNSYNLVPLDTRKIDINAIIMNGQIGAFKAMNIQENNLGSFKYVWIPFNSNGEFTNTSSDIDLNAFYSNYGEVSVDSFKPVISQSILSVIDYTKPNN